MSSSENHGQKSSETSASDSQILDARIMASLRELQADDEPNFLIDIIDTFLEDGPKRLEAIQNAISLGDSEQLHRLAHSFKGASSSLGALSFSKVCGAIEEVGRSGSIAEAEPLFSILLQDYEKVRVALVQERDNS
ncbi:MAG: Hpt domain-containing protein [Gloeobacterales cyanobacterium]